MLQICLAEAGFSCVCKRRIHKATCQLHTQSFVLPIHILAVCQMGLGGIRNGESSFFQEEQQGPSVKNGLQAAALAQTSEAWPHSWAGRWCFLQDIAILEPCGIGSARRCETGVGAVFPALFCWELMVQPARAGRGPRFHHQVLIRARHDTLCCMGPSGGLGPRTPWGDAEPGSLFPSKPS